MENSIYFRVIGTSASIDEFQIRQKTYKLAIKLEPESGPCLEFNTAYSNHPEVPTPLYSVRRSPNLPFAATKSSKSSGLNDVPPYFSFYFELERDLKKQKVETCTLFLKHTSKVNSVSLVKYGAHVDCPCIVNSNDETESEDEGDCHRNEKMSLVTDRFPDCNKAEMVDFNQRSCLQLVKHAHDCKVYGLAQTFFVTITEFDFSEATLVPYEALKILTKRTFEKEVKDTGGAYFDEIGKPFDVTIICKDGYEIDVHSFVLSTRNSVFRKIISSSTKVSGRISFRRLLSRETFMGRGERNKKSKTVTIDESEIPSTAMEVILHFIYFGELHPNWRVELVSVLHGARKYGLKQLLDFLNVLLITLCKKKNALYLLKLAERYSLKGAENAINDYIFTNLGGVLQASVKITSV